LETLYSKLKTKVEKTIVSNEEPKDPTLWLNWFNTTNLTFNVWNGRSWDKSTVESFTTDKLSSISADLWEVTAWSIVVWSTNKLWLNELADWKLAIWWSIKANAPFYVNSNWDLRWNTLTNKSIFFENVSPPSSSDWQLYCNDNWLWWKVLNWFFWNQWFTQQLSMSWMEKSWSFDNTSNWTISVSTWFYPRTITFSWFYENIGLNKSGVVTGKAWRIYDTSWFCNYTEFDNSNYNLVWDLSIWTKNNVVSDLSIDFWTSSASWMNNTILGSYSYASYPYTIFYYWSIPKLASDRLWLCYATISWISATWFTINITVPAWWRLAWYYTVIW
jgi:hypothetical protein